MSKEFPAAPRVAVGAVVTRGREVLLVRRRDPPNAGEWAVPGGSVRLGESLQAAAEREVLEETGVRVRAREPVYAFDKIVVDPDDRVRYHYVVVDLRADYVAGEPAPRDDALDASWLDSRDLDAAQVNAVTLRLLRDKLGF